jgi:5-formyltetrahydrofolate cyclo-ligase
MAVPRLRGEACFLELDPERIGDLKKASSIKGAFELGRPVRIDDMPPIDLVLCGSVAVTRSGRRLGKGGGFSDLELALLVQAGKIRAGTSIVTTVHPVPIVRDLPVLEHDFRVDFIVTPERVIRCPASGARPGGVYWDLLDPEKIEEIPALRSLVRARTPPRGKRGRRERRTEDRREAE